MMRIRQTTDVNSKVLQSPCSQMKFGDVLLLQKFRNKALGHCRAKRIDGRLYGHCDAQSLLFLTTRGQLNKIMDETNPHAVRMFLQDTDQINAEPYRSSH